MRLMTWRAVWVGGYVFEGAGIRAIRTESSLPPNRPNFRIFPTQVKMPILVQTVKYSKILPFGAAQNTPEYARIRPSTESSEVSNPQPSGQSSVRPLYAVAPEGLSLAAEGVGGVGGNTIKEMEAAAEVKAVESKVGAATAGAYTRPLFGSTSALSVG